MLRKDFPDVEKIMQEADVAYKLLKYCDKRKKG